MSIPSPSQGMTEPNDCDLLDEGTSAALLRWMESGAVPDGVRVDQWEQWVALGCCGLLRANGVAVTPAMLGHWARTGSLP